MMAATCLLVVAGVASVLLHANVALLTAFAAATHDAEQANFVAGGQQPSALWLAGELPQNPQQEAGLRSEAANSLAQLLARVGPNMRASSDYHDFTDVQLNESILAWKQLHEQAKLFAQGQVKFYRPQLEALLRDAQVSEQCQKSVQLAFDSMKELNSWSIKMWNAMGNFPPVGLFEGTFTDAGSYHSCVGLRIPSAQDTNTNSSDDAGGYASYCTVGFRPIVPTRPAFHQIFESVDGDLVNLFNRSDALNAVAQNAQYFYYLYSKTGVCVPYECSAVDIQQVASLVGRRLALTAAPVKCFTQAPISRLLGHHHHNEVEVTAAPASKTVEPEWQPGQRESRPILVTSNKPLNLKQTLAAIVVSAFFCLVFSATLWHLFEIVLTSVRQQHDVNIPTSAANEKRKSSNGIELEAGRHLDDDEKAEQMITAAAAAAAITTTPATIESIPPKPMTEYTGLKHVAFHYLSMITNWNEFLDTSMRPNEIKCLHGLRVFTMVWIICVHTLQYNDWSAFSRTFEIIKTLQNPTLHPIYNANYVVDNFFFMSGLLVAYTTWYTNKGSAYNFSLLSSLVGRYLRLTPQVLLISLLYILLPLAGESPFWYDMTHYAAKECERNWWVNLLHLQAFYREDEICNLVGWWISVDMFYFVLALGLVYMILNNQVNRALFSTILLVGGCLLQSAYRHYTGGYTPNNLGTVPQVAEVWTRYVVNFFWSPYPHAYPFYLGLWTGYVIANNKWRRQVRDWSRLGWCLATASLCLVNMSSHVWMSGAVDIGNQYISTAYNNICTIVWATAFAWAVVACHYGSAPALNRLLSVKLFVLLSKASFIIYLSHLLLVRIYFGQQSAPVEVSVYTITFAVVGNVFQSIIFGVFLCVAFEGPCMKFQKFVLQKLKREKGCRSQSMASKQTGNEQLNRRASATLDMVNGDADSKLTIGHLQLGGPTGKALLK